MRRAPRLEVLVCLVVFLQAIEDVVDGGAHVAGGAVLSEFAASEAGVGPLRGVVLAGGRRLGVSRLL
ncbi:MAG: hypothetical protein ACO2PN_29105 [Pyrobaculum sp.]